MEFSHGFGSGNSLSLMVAPFDFGYPISLKLNGIKEDVALNDIVAPSALVSYGVANYPLSLGIAYQKGRNIAGASSAEERVLFFLSCDMPLWTFY